jgi:tripartite-type tricarboxylate transporter receptor subunit TctC
LSRPRYHRAGNRRSRGLSRTRTTCVALLVAAACLAAPAANAQAWPAKPVRIIVPFAPGGTSDSLGRVVAQKLSESLKQTFIVENRGGAGGVIGSEIVARAPPDGYTLVVSGIASHVIAPALPGGVPFDPIKDFTHIALFGGPPAVLVVNPSVPAKDLKEFVAFAKAKPNALAYASPGNGTNGHLVAEMFKRLAGLEMAHVPYKGAGPAIGDLIAGHVSVASTTLTTVGPQIHAGKARALAVSGERRVPEYPDVPTYREQGYPELVSTVWFSLSGPAGMPPEIVAKLNAEVRRALKSPDVQERLRLEGIETGDLDPAAFTAFVEAELARWSPLVRATKAKAD